MAATALSTRRENMTDPSAAAAFPALAGGLSDQEREPCQGTGFVAFAGEGLQIVCAVVLVLRSCVRDNIRFQATCLRGAPTLAPELRECDAAAD